jgi:deazaflavin-dependent oxidoreductase (nitroreductase family)
VGPKNNYMLTATGRNTGLPRSTPVSLVVEGQQRWLVAPYGDVAWVRNARAAGRVTLARGKQSEVVSITELESAESAPVLKTYITNVGVTRSYFDVRPDSSLEAFAAEAPRHPVFLIGPTA